MERIDCIKDINHYWVVDFSSVPNNHPSPTPIFFEKVANPHAFIETLAPPTRLINILIFVRKTCKRITLLSSKNFNWNVQIVFYVERRQWLHTFECYFLKINVVINKHFKNFHNNLKMYFLLYFVMCFMQ